MNSGVHDEINLARLVRRLGKSVAHEEWNTLDSNGDTWLKAEGVLQRIKFARKLLKNCDEFSDADGKKSHLFDDWRSKLDSAECAMKDVRDRAQPQPFRPPPILPLIPMSGEGTGPVKEELPSGDSQTRAEVGGMIPKALPLPAEQLLFSPSDNTPLPSASLPSSLPTFLPSNFPPSASASIDTAAVASGASRFHQTSNALHQDLSEQLAQMAVQLKRNALHFSDSLSKDKAIVEDAQQKLESNFDVMQKERIRLRDHRGKSSSTTWLVVAIVLVVVLLFSLMVLLIRLTRTI